jgi:hypothetical protein
MFTCDIDLSEYRTLVGRSLDTIEKQIDRAVEHAAIEGAEEARRVGRYQDRTGRLRSGIVAHFVSSSGRSVTWEILSPAPYSVYVENPTRPHIIRARNARALRFEAGGQTLFRKQVQHPGTPGFPFMGPGYQQAERTLWRELERIPGALARVWA